METIKIKKGSYRFTEDWMMKEYGSWEDHDHDYSHACAIVERENATKSNYMVLTIKEAKTLLTSAEYQCRAGWDDWDDHLDKARYEKCMKGYVERLKKAINSINY